MSGFKKIDPTAKILNGNFQIIRFRSRKNVEFAGLGLFTDFFSG